MKRAGRITIGIALDVLALAFMVSAAGAATIKGKVTD
jgi:hypothetical protein